MTHAIFYILAGIGAWFLLSAVLAVIAAWVLRSGAAPELPEDDDTEHA